MDVEPFALCHISHGWRLRLPAPPVPLLHFVLRGEGAVGGSTEPPRPFVPSVHFFRAIASTGSLPWLDALEDSRLGRAIDRILEAPSARHTVDSLAAAASMSRSAFAEKFTGAFGQPPMALVQQVRMRHAAHLLRQATTLSVDEVAERTGYASRSHFSAVFQRQFGTSPAAFRGRRP